MISGSFVLTDPEVERTAGIVEKRRRQRNELQWRSRLGCSYCKISSRACETVTLPLESIILAVKLHAGKVTVGSRF
jgi:hypothetical protein